MQGLHDYIVGSLPWGGFDNNTTPLDVSLGTIDLVPKNQPYDCKVYDASNQLVGELGWDGNGTLIAPAMITARFLKKAAGSRRRRPG